MVGSAGEGQDLGGFPGLYCYGVQGTMSKLNVALVRDV